MSGEGHPEDADEIVENALHRLIRTVLRGDEARGAHPADEFLKPEHRGRPVRERLEAERLAYDRELAAAGLPLPYMWVVIRGDRAHRLPPEKCDRIRAQYGEHFEVVHPDADMRIETGRNFVIRRIEPFSYHFWLSRLSYLARLIVQLGDTEDNGASADRNTLEQLLIVYGVERQRFLASHFHLEKVEWAEARTRNIDEIAKQRQAAARPWHERAGQLAAEMWKTSPGRTATAVARSVRQTFEKEERRVREEIERDVVPALLRAAEVEDRIRTELRARGLLNADGKLPSERSIRREISSLAPTQGAK